MSRGEAVLTVLGATVGGVGAVALLVWLVVRDAEHYSERGFGG